MSRFQKNSSVSVCDNGQEYQHKMKIKDKKGYVLT